MDIFGLNLISGISGIHLYVPLINETYLILPYTFTFKKFSAEIIIKSKLNLNIPFEYSFITSSSLTLSIIRRAKIIFKNKISF